MASVLFCDPHILEAFYTEGNGLYDDLALAITNFETNDSTKNFRIMKAKMLLAVGWLRIYASEVQEIANLAANAETRQDAADNITTSFLTPEKLVQSSKGDPDVPVLTGKRSMIDGSVDLEVVNRGVGFKPTSIVFVGVLLPETPVTVPVTPPIADPVVTLKDGQITVETEVATQIVTISLDGKGRFISFSGLKIGRRYAFYAYTKNGKKQISLLSEPVIRKA